MNLHVSIIQSQKLLVFWMFAFNDTSITESDDNDYLCTISWHIMYFKLGIVYNQQNLICLFYSGLWVLTKTDTPK
jgi:hypothetical protein